MSENEGAVISYISFLYEFHGEITYLRSYLLLHLRENGAGMMKAFCNFV